MLQLRSNGCGDADDCRVIRHILHNDGTSSNHGVATDPDTLPDDGPNADVRAFSDKYRAAENRTG